MANETKDQPVLGHIDRLVKEEERLYDQSALTDDDRDRLAKITWNWTSVGTCCVSAGPCESLGVTQNRQRCARRRSLKTTSSSPGPQVRATGPRDWLQQGLRTTLADDL
jgi:hypothetical protein